MESQVKSPVLLFDGVCNLCNGAVQWVLLRDRRGVFRFAALQSDTGQAMLRQFGFAAEDFDTVVLIDGDRVFTRSDAALEVVRRIGGFWPVLYAFKIIPRPIRDAVYNWVARNRYRWFGRQEQCMLPRKEWMSRFV
ncbi:MAG: thiol-disulfide oxidoreductase DCC family protein [Saprospiraceae bacterium]|nr:thiol-disulfide oxidoreductase DCC family protein [Saprospiraceae bacterium]